MDLGLAGALDNLYKFIFIGGLTLMVTAELQINSIEQKIIDTGTNLLENGAEYEMRMQWLKEDSKATKEVEKISKTLDSVLGRQGRFADKDLAMNVVRTLHLQNSDWEARVKQLVRENMRMEQFDRELSVGKKKYKVKQEKYDFLRNRYMRLSKIGMTSAVLGMFLWHFYYQRHADQIIETQAMEAVKSRGGRKGDGTSFWVIISIVIALWVFILAT